MNFLIKLIFLLIVPLISIAGPGDDIWEYQKMSKKLLEFRCMTAIFWLCQKIFTGGH